MTLKLFYFIDMQPSWLKLLKREFMMLMLRPEWKQESKSIMYFCDSLKYFSLFIERNYIGRMKILELSQLFYF